MSLLVDTSLCTGAQTSTASGNNTLSCDVLDGPAIALVAVAKRSWSSASLVCAFCSMFGPALIFFLWGSKGPAVVAVCMREEGTPATQHVVHLQMRVITEPLDFWSSRCAANFVKVE